ncbi:MAG: glycoside hydrolase family 28 protein, partial [Acidobacteriota bacterium]|nr:glycoside hydrolase family 28 protein [Acidobacteriota bacterium]
SYTTIPKDMKNIPAHWVVMNTAVTPIERGYCDFRDITIKNVKITGAKQIFTASGLPDKLIQNVKFINITAQGNDAGSIEYAKNWTMQNVNLKTANGKKVEIKNSENVESPLIEK